MRRTTWADCLRYGSGAQWREGLPDCLPGCECDRPECVEWRKENKPTQETDDAYDND